MLKYMLRRCVEMAGAMLVMSLLVFMLGRALGDPVSLLLSDYATAEDRALLTQELGLDKPLAVQYLTFLSKALRGDLGRSISADRQPVVDSVMRRLPASLQLAAAALLVSLLVGIPLGILAALRYDSWIDHLVRGIALVGQSVPVFWLGIVLMFIFSVLLGWLPTSGYGQLRNIVLPAATMSLFSIAAVTRLTRNSMREALDSDYVRLARIKGLAESRVIWQHALSNSLVPVLTFMGTFFATMITGAVVIETVFGWPGIGRLAFEAILARDFPLMQAVVLVMTALFMSANLAVDVLQAWLDPRVRL
ncbi:MAG: ABC transporter permease [Gammaproteobacteria bacterium]|nr:ABC transporter permease [Gammaproteobacteria bacterium]